MSGQRTQASSPDVLIVGGGLVGLTAALALRHHGLAVTLVEKHAATSPQPKARRFHMRTMEIFRELGLAALVREAARDLAGHDHFAAGRTLAESVQQPLHIPGGHTIDELSPELPCLIAQDQLEPLLRQAASDAGAEIRFGTRLAEAWQDADGVVGILADGEKIEAQYLLAADGARSEIRRSLGIARSGRGDLGEPSTNVYFRADLADVVRGREFNLCKIEHPDAAGWLASIDGRARWVFTVAGDRADRAWPNLLRTALGVPAPDLDVLSVLTWQPQMLVADAFSAGRIHLAGDAAHVMPPYAASGANTGIADVHNLAWKLAAVLHGQADPALLDSYDAERRPAGYFVADQSARRSAGFASGVPDPSLAHPFVLALGGYQYTHGAVIAVDQTDPEPTTEFAPAGRVGTRIPHRWLDAARTRSTIDAAGPAWAVLKGGGPLTDFLPQGQHILLRPDHIVAWRGTDPDAAADAKKTLAEAAPR
ncbi:FAD-dependent oxidoreductase [Actinospica robiniae]|uniref:FAD-dependent oxidoreductase n=1 Tax=Actinospica robiniae TaxID=304901 RepID=UPI00041C3169|nr:FAD-dependent oxidoreductase [Actinospica robiniae]